MGRPPSYPLEFRVEAVRLARSPGHSVPEVAADLGLNRRTVNRWAQQLDVDEGQAQGLSTAERAEIVRLRRRVAVLEEERAILVKAAAFFAKETDGTR
jgi:transposase-like protein